MDDKLYACGLPAGLHAFTSSIMVFEHLLPLGLAAFPLLLHSRFEVITDLRL